MEKRATNSRLPPHLAKFLTIFRFVWAPFTTLRGRAMRDTPTPSLQNRQKLGLTINVNNSNLTAAPCIGSEIP